jgi:muramoyltetrapeptide carboxypeptidase
MVTASMRRLVVASVIVASTMLAEDSSGQQESGNWVKPPALRWGDTIAFVAPSGPANLEQLKVYKRALEVDGYRVIMPEGIDRRQGYLAGSDDQRAEELNEMIRNPEVRAIFPARGGYGLTRILDRLDYQALRADPKIIIGYSDITALHLAIARKARVVTFHSPVPMSNLYRGHQPEFAYAEALFRRAILKSEYPEEAIGYLITSLAGSHSATPEPQTLVGGKAQGRLIGGNLTLISATMGTEYEIDPRGGILFLEDVDEAPYRVDRMLSQLRLSGVLDNVAGVILGDFSHQDGATQIEMQQVLRSYFEKSSRPVIWKFPVGHLSSNATLPIGVMAEMDADQCWLQLLENPVGTK